jgi:hypothetical protein
MKEWETLSSHILASIGKVVQAASWSWMGNSGIRFLNQTGDSCDDLTDYRTEYYSLDESELKPRDGEPSRGYDRAVLQFRTKMTPWRRGYPAPESTESCISRTGNMNFRVGWEADHREWLNDHHDVNKVYCVLDCHSPPRL